VVVPREFIDLARDVCRHRDADRFALLYRVLYRLTHGQRDLLNVEVDEDVHRLMVLHRQVGTDRHRMLGFVRFERLEDAQGEFYFAWYRPDHRVLRSVAPEFVRRLPAMRWSILTPDECAHWDTEHLSYSPGVASRPDRTDQIVDLWKVYYAATYNPQRRNPRAMARFMPARFLANLPESEAKLPDSVELHPETPA
jgi:DNA polymerase